MYRAKKSGYDGESPLAGELLTSANSGDLELIFRSTLAESLLPGRGEPLASAT
jgi:hypothetical protein